MSKFRSTKLSQAAESACDSSLLLPCKLHCGTTEYLTYQSRFLFTPSIKINFYLGGQIGASGNRKQVRGALDAH
jgi:hypothetical protein